MAMEKQPILRYYIKNKNKVINNSTYNPKSDINRQDNYRRIPYYNNISLTPTSRQRTLQNYS